MLCSLQLPLLPEDVAPGQPLVDWRVVYEAKSQEYERRKQVSAQRIAPALGSRGGPEGQPVHAGAKSA